MLISSSREYCMYRYSREISTEVLTLIKYVDLRVLRVALKRVCDDFVGSRPLYAKLHQRAHYSVMSQTRLR